MRRVFTIVGLLALVGASPARAQDQWGFSTGLTPSWRTGSPAKSLFGADQIDMKGSEVRVGVVRGNEVGSDWGLSFVDKSIAENSTLEVDTRNCPPGQCGTFFRTDAHTRLTGIELHQYQPFKTWRDRVQLGMVGAVGIGWLRGTLYKRTMTEQSVVESIGVPADQLFPPSASVVPLLKLEIAGTGIVAPGLKVRVSGGFSMPGYHTFGLTAIYLVPSW